MECRKKTKPEQKIYSVGYVGALLGKCDRTLYRAIRAGKIQAIRMGGSIGISESELQRICERGF
jgi:excisionase family DNA binding protein